MYGEETAGRQYVKKKITQREPEYDKNTDRHGRKSTQVKWGGRDGRREPDSGLGYTQDWNPQRWTADRDRETEGRQMSEGIPEITGIRRSSQWDFPRRRALFTSDGTYSGSSESDTSEGHVDQPPEGQYDTGRRTEEGHDEDGVEELGFPHKTLERAVNQLRQELNDCRTELEITKRLSPAPGVNRRQSRQARFASTPVPRYSGKSNWEQYREKFEAIVCSNGWDKVTAALQLLSHLDGDALNVALLVPESHRAVPEFLINSLSDHYNSPGRRAEYKRQFQRVVRRPEDDPSVFAIELETLARRAFTDIDSSIQRQMVPDRFIDGQAECALRRHLDSLIPDTPMSDIVDSCRVWESHRDVETEPGMRSNRRHVHAICQVAVDEQIRMPLPEKESLEEIISKLLPTPAPPKTRKDPIPSAIVGNISSIDTSSSETISSDRLGDYVAKLAASRNSQRGYGGVTEGINSIR